MEKMENAFSKKKDSYQSESLYKGFDWGRDDMFEEIDLMIKDEGQFNDPLLPYEFGGMDLYSFTDPPELSGSGDQFKFPPLPNQGHRRSRTAPISRILQPDGPPALNLNPTQKARRPPKPTGGKISDNFTVGQNTRPIYLPNDTSEDESFTSLCQDRNYVINPHTLGFIPSDYWLNESYMFGDIVRDFFQRKNHPSCRFSHKLYNALKLTESSHSYFTYTGVEWASSEILHINKVRFARLLGIKSIDGSLFHQQGNFPAFGFAELTLEQIKRAFGDKVINGLDLQVEKYMIHNPKKFVSTCSEQDISDDVKWKGVRQRALL